MRADGRFGWHSSSKADMTAEGAMPGGFGGPMGPRPHKEKVLPRYTSWPQKAEPGNLGPPVGAYIYIYN